MLSANPTSAVSIVAILALVVSLGGLAWNVTIWVIKRREERAAKQQRADLTLTSNGKRTLRFYPIGGHRNPWSTTAFHLTIDNLGNAKAEDVIVKFDLPHWVHSARPRVFTYPVLKPDGSIEEVPLESDERELKFRVGGLLGGGIGETTTVSLDRAVYPDERREAGLVSVGAPAGIHRFRWRIESSSGIVDSTDLTAITVVINDNAVGHDPVPWDPETGPDRTQCAECRRLATRTPQQIAAEFQAMMGDQSPE